MEHFKIYDDEHPAPERPTSHFFYEPGNWRYTGLSHNVLALEDDGEPIHVWVAVKRRTAIADLADDQEFTLPNFRGAYA